MKQRNGYLILLTASALLLAAGCVGSDTQRCSWGAYCPTGTLCDDDRERCVAPGQVEVCRGRDDGFSCRYSGAPEGYFYCVAGLCELARCGDGVVGALEKCDDGNNLSGDGCSADCLSVEACGNGYTDSALGEGCDDGNQTNHDGCASSCVMEFPRWQTIRPTLPGLFGASVASDVAQARVVVHGGVMADGNFLDAAWSFDGSSWARLQSAVEPSLRMDAAMAYDPIRERVLLHGGWGGYESLNDTWELRGETWQALETAHAPAARSGAPMVYDSHRDRMVRFGGELAVRDVLDDTWEFDGVDWLQVQPTEAPAARRYHGLAYDPLRERVVLFGGSYGYPEWTFLGDTWEYDGQSWIQRFPAQSPPPRDGHTLVWDPDAERVVLFGGVGPSGLHADTWEYDGVSWRLLTSDANPSERAQFVLAHDPTQARLLLVGGTTGGYQSWEDMWQLVGADWRRVHDHVPGRRLAAGMTYDADRGRVLMYGGTDGFPTGNVLDGTWEYDGYTWTRIHTVSSPGVRAGHSLVHDVGRQRSVLFGGFGSMSFADCSDELWEFDGTDWTHRDVGGGPSPRGLTAAGYDPERGVAVFFGGACDSVDHSDVWEYDGASWHEVARTGEADEQWPSARVGAAMAWDPDRGSLVMFGGHTSSGTALGDTWSYREQVWQPILGLSSPSPRAGHALVFNAARRHVTVLGGFGIGRFTDTWELHGSTWIQLSINLPPSGRYGSSVVYYPVDDSVVVYGGIDWRGNVLDDWFRYRFESAASDEFCYGGVDDDGDELVDCDDPDCEGRPCGFMQVCLLGECF